MPIATVARTEEKFELKTLPGAFVVVRRMTYGEKLERQDDMIQMSLKDKDEGMAIGIMNKKMALKDFGNLIVEHNLTDENERQLNFRDAKDVVSLDPRIGEEVSRYIEKINSFEELPEIKNS